jgi:hypothetical protein
MQKKFGIAVVTVKTCKFQTDPPGEISFQCRFDSADWETIAKMKVAQGTIAGAPIAATVS